MKYFLLLSCVLLNIFLINGAPPVTESQELQNLAGQSRYQIYVNNVCFFITRDENGFCTFSHLPTPYPVSEEASIEAYTVLYYEYLSEIFYDYGAEHDD